MRPIITSTIFTIVIIIIYQFVDINLFAIDLPRRVSSELFKSLRNDPGIETEIVIFDIEYVHLDTVRALLEILESFEPRSIGVNLCNIQDKSKTLDDYLNQNEKITTCDCRPNSNKGTSRITTSDNEVTHFQTDKDSYFEFQLSNNLKELKERGKKKERINFREMTMYYQLPLSDIEYTNPEIIKDRIVIVGFLRDSLVTPINSWYGRPGTIQGDMSDAQISANIISTINRSEFINEINSIIRVIIVLTISLICTGLIRTARTKYIVLNISLGLIIFIVLNGLSSFLIVYAFTKNYYLELNEMTVVLIVVSILSVYWNARTDKAPAHNTGFV